MSFGFGNLIGIGILAVWLPILTALHFFHSTPTKRPVSSHFLWQQALRKKTRRSWWQKFENSIFFLLQLLGSLALGLGLSEPWLGLQREIPPPYVILDVSASMAADAGGMSRFQKGLDEAALQLRKARVDRIQPVCVAEDWIQAKEPMSLSQGLNHCQQTWLSGMDISSLAAWAQTVSTQTQKIFVTDRFRETDWSILEQNDFLMIVVEGEAENVFLEEVQAWYEKEGTALSLVVGATRSAKVRARIQDETGRSLEVDWVLPEGSSRKDVKLSFRASQVEVELAALEGKDVFAYDNHMVIPVSAGLPRISLKGLREDSYIRRMLSRWIELSPLAVEAPELGQKDVGYWNDGCKTRLCIVPSNGEKKIRGVHTFVTARAHPLTRYLDGGAMQPASWQFGGWDSYEILARSAETEGGSSIPVLGCRGEGFPCFLNLLDQEEMLSDMDTALLLKNAVQMLENFHQKSRVLDLKPNTQKLVLQIATVSEAQKPYPGLYRSEEGELEFHRIPPSESRLVQEPGQIRGSFAKMDQNELDTRNLAGIFLVLAGLILILEGWLYARRTPC